MSVLNGKLQNEKRKQERKDGRKDIRLRSLASNYISETCLDSFISYCVLRQRWAQLRPGNVWKWTTEGRMYLTATEFSRHGRNWRQATTKSLMNRHLPHIRRTVWRRTHRSRSDQTRPDQTRPLPLNTPNDEVQSPKISAQHQQQCTTNTFF